MYLTRSSCCSQLTNEPTDFVMGRHGLLLLFRDRRDNRQWSSCLLPDVVSRLACKERALQVLVRKSGYQGKVRRHVEEEEEEERGEGVWVMR